MSTFMIEDGKYEVTNDNGIVSVKRYGEDWGYEADKFTLCLIQEIERLRDFCHQLAGEESLHQGGIYETEMTRLLKENRELKSMVGEVKRRVSFHKDDVGNTLFEELQHIMEENTPKEGA
ncbi:hypothetical protein IMZ31_18920 (plasmid) [Pontibacillus sp. ALD_SL1]|uniref:hypothetical protein n=1 Tax=Pontibacillus sp. ALD_SL1 TaxID=2777185 RepID=UPI001A9742C1|nr:hypothetical protein [Pontibacillus sp. ALD_SL1]QST02622.1 hypothetical protein IMZ31_18920 [Pontibacillus sp. ALD_SL1]